MSLYAYCGEIPYGKETFQMCSSCFSLKYCSKRCQKLHWNNHKTLCLSIKELLRQKSASYAQTIDESSFLSHLTPKQTSKIAKLVGKRCLISCKINGKETDALFDTSAQVSIVSQFWLESNLPKTKLQNISEILDKDLDLKAANGTNIQYIGWVEIDFAMASDDTHNDIIVPFLVTSVKLDNPIVGYNVIEEAIKGNISDGLNTDISLVNSVTATLRESNRENIPAFIDFIYENAINDDDLCVLKTSKKAQIIPKGETVTVRC